MAAFISACNLSTNDNQAIHNHDTDSPHSHGTTDIHNHSVESIDAATGNDGHIHDDDKAHSHDDGETHSHDDGETHNHDDDKAHSHGTASAPGIIEDDGHVHEADNAGQHSGIVPHTLYRVKKMPFNAIIRTSGIIMVDSRDEVAITAGTQGLVEFIDHFLFPGVKVNKGTSLFTLSGKNITGNSRDVEYARAEAGYIKAVADMQRADSLVGLKLITAERYNAIKNEFAVASAIYDSYRSNSGKSATTVKAPNEGFIKDIVVREGEIVETGRILAVMTMSHNMILKADLPPTLMNRAQAITGARFSPGYSDRVYSIEEMGGSMLSYGRSTGDNSFYIPVFFRFDFTDELIPGSFADVWLLGNTIEDALLVPNRAILEDYGKKYLLLENAEGSFEKIYFTPGDTDGIYTIAKAGLSGGEVIVDEGAYQIKMSLNSSAPAAHTH